MTGSSCEILNGGDTVQRSRRPSRSEQSTGPGSGPPHTRKCNVHCNSLWSLWYGLSVLALQGYIIYKCVSRFLTYISLPWPEAQQPYLELNLYVGLVGAGVVLLPFFFISFMFKIGNLANDGYKLGYSLSTCSMDPPSVLARSGGIIRNAWHHGGPTSAFIHLVSSFCFLLPRLIIEAKLLEVGFLSRDSIWKTDLDWLVPNNDRLIVLSFFTGGSASGVTNTESTTVGAPVNHPADQIRKFLETEDYGWEPFSAEYINYAIALLVYAVRYPAVFWNTNKALSFLFSLQLIGNGLQNLLAYSAMCVLYKVQVAGPQNVLHKYEPFLLNIPISMLLYLLSITIVTASSCVIYMYGYQKFVTFLQTEREKKSIILAEGANGGLLRTSLWTYFPHTAAMCTLIALAVCNGPLLYDFIIVYKGSLDGTVLVFVIGTVLHLFLWIVTWLFLTVKMAWKFKLRVTVGRAAVHNARSIKLVNDVDLSHRPVERESAPMLIVGFGKTFTVHDPAPKKLIMRTLARAAMESDRALEEEETYWLKGDVAGVGGSTPSKLNGPSSSSATLMRVHASPNLTKRPTTAGAGSDCSPLAGGGDGIDLGDSSCSSPRRGTSVTALVAGAGGQRSPQTNTVQDTDDRIPKESVYGTIRPKSKSRSGEIPDGAPCVVEQHVVGHQHAIVEDEEIDDHLPPPPIDHNYQTLNQHHRVDDDEEEEVDGELSCLSGARPPPPHLAVMAPPKPAPRKGQDVLDVHTPRSNRSIDSGLPDSSSTTSSTSPPGGHVTQTYADSHHGNSTTDAHRKSTSLDNINIQQQQKQMQEAGMGQQPHQMHSKQQQQPWKSFSLQRGTMPPSSSSELHQESGGASSTVLLMRGSGATGSSGVSAVNSGSREEDVYGRCTNMKLTSFCETGGPGSGLVGGGDGVGPLPRDPRIIDLAQSTAASMHGPHISSYAAVSYGPTAALITTSAAAAPTDLTNTTPVNGVHSHLSTGVGPPPAKQGSSTGQLPFAGNNGAAAYHQPQQHNNLLQMAPSYPVNSSGSGFNTLPAQPVTGGPAHHQYNGGAGGLPHQQPQQQQHNTLPARMGADMVGAGPRGGPHSGGGRHFKPFDHRKMNPMMAEITENPYEQHSSDGAMDNTNTYVVHHNKSVPYMPAELRHTNYGIGASAAGPGIGGGLLHPQVAQHRDSANYSMASSASDSG